MQEIYQGKVIPSKKNDHKLNLLLESVWYQDILMCCVKHKIPLKAVEGTMPHGLSELFKHDQGTSGSKAVVCPTRRDHTMRKLLLVWL